MSPLQPAAGAAGAAGESGTQVVNAAAQAAKWVVQADGSVALVPVATGAAATGATATQVGVVGGALSGVGGQIHQMSVGGQSPENGPDSAELQGEVSFGKNVDKKIRKHIDQVRNRGPVKEDIPSPGRRGIERVQEIIRQRVAQGGGRATTFADEPAIAFEDGGVTYIFRPSGEFWTILVNR